MDATTTLLKLIGDNPLPLYKICEKAGVSHTAVWKWMRGKQKNLTLRDAEKLYCFLTGRRNSGFLLPVPPPPKGKLNEILEATATMKLPAKEAPSPEKLVMRIDAEPTLVQPVLAPSPYERGDDPEADENFNPDSAPEQGDFVKPNPDSQL